MQTRENYITTQDEAENLMKKMLEDKSQRNIVRIFLCKNEFKLNF